MRGTLASMTVVMLAGIGSGIAVSDAAAGALPKVEASTTASGLVENTAMRRYYRRHGYVTEVPGERAVVVPREPAVVVVRPTNCGEFKYWDGMTCVDKRYTERHFK
jgi:hypothetical protein